MKFTDDEWDEFLDKFKDRATLLKLHQLKKKRFPNLTSILPGYGYAIVVTEMDHTTDRGAFRRFDSPEEAEDYVHDISMKQSPEWHEKHCRRCDLRKHEMSFLSEEVK